MKRFIGLLVLGIAAMLILASSGTADVLYSEAFVNTTGVDIAIDDHPSEWNVRYELNADAEVINSSGKISGRESKIARATGPDGEGGYIYLQAKDAHVDVDTEIVVYREQTFGQASYEIDSFVWQMRNDYDTNLARIALRLDEDWYVSDETFTQESTWAEQEMTFTTAASAWRTLILDADGGEGSDIEVGELLSSDLPAADITAFGVYFGNNESTMLIGRVDDFTINGSSLSGLDGDLNSDGFVGGDDLDIVRSFWGQNVTAGNLLQGDPSNDGFVGGDDLDIVRANWGQGTPPAPSSVPEPSSLLLALTGLVLLWGRRSRK